MSWFEMLKAERIQPNEAMDLARKLVIPYIEAKIREIPQETITLFVEGSGGTRYGGGKGHRVTGHFFNDIEVNTWLGEKECRALAEENPQWRALVEETMIRTGTFPYPYNQDPALTGGECNIQSPEYVMQAIIQRLPDHNITIDVVPVGFQNHDRLDTRIEATRDRNYQCGFKYRYKPDTRSKIGSQLETGKVLPKEDDSKPDLW